MGIAAAVFVIRYSLRLEDDRRIFSSCTNHANSLRLMIEIFMEENDQFPANTGTRAALGVISGNDPVQIAWLAGAGATFAGPAQWHDIGSGFGTEPSRTLER